MTTNKATAAAVRRMRPMGWGDSKHKLHRLGVIESPVADVPKDWQEAFKAAFRK
jgi:hypothetical protein